MDGPLNKTCQKNNVIFQKSEYDVLVFLDYAAVLALLGLCYMQLSP